MTHRLPPLPPCRHVSPLPPGDPGEGPGVRERAPAVPPPPPGRPTPPATEALARAADELGSLHGALGLGPALDAKGRRLANAHWNVSSEALRKAAELAERFGIDDFDAAGARAAADYELEAATVVARARVLLQTLEDDIASQHAVHARATFSLFATLKALARLRDDPYLAGGADELAAYVAPAGRRARKADDA